LDKEKIINAEEKDFLDIEEYKFDALLVFKNS
jgi:hypothetical protein